MRIDWEERTPLEDWLPKRSPTRGLLEGDDGLTSAGTFAFSPEFPTPAPSRTIAPAVGEALAAWHREAGAPEASVAGAELLARGAGAVVTGQQTGLMGGPLLTLLKAMTAVRLAGELSRREGRPFVPLFWAEGEDHDIGEVNQVTTLGEGYAPLRLELPVPEGFGEGPAGRLPLGRDAVDLVERFFSSSRETEFTEEVRAGLLADLEGSADLSRWFCRQMLRLLGSRGLVVLESKDPRFKELARPFWVPVLEDPLALTAAVRETGESLAARGYRPPLFKEKRRCAFFLIDEGRRLPVFFERGSFRAGERRYTPLELRRRLEDNPRDFSPSVHLRPLLQDWLLPTAAYVGGPSEMAYLLQILPGYSWAGIPAPAFVMRASLTLVEPPVRTFLRRQETAPADLAKSIDGILNAAVRRENRVGDAARWEKLRESTRRPLERLAAGFSPAEAHLADLVEKTSGKIDFQLKDLEKKAVAALRRRSETLRDQLTRSRNRLFPLGLLQERVLSPCYFMNKYGPDFVTSLLEGLPTDFTGHHFGTIIP
jgi:bacillithiol biosynthesis cysteine-adding enzyme BshC